MRRFSLAISITLAIWLLTSGLAEAQHGRGPSGGPAGPATSDRSQMPDHSNRSGRESSESGSINHEHQMQSKMTVTEQLDRNTHLAAQLQGLFPTGTDLKQASNGFKNLGQFVAAAHVSHNLGIPFDQLKSKMTGDSPVSLGKAIQELRPETDAKGEAKKAERQAKEEIKDAEAARKNQAAS
jgi:hypothetical protein